MTQEEVVRMARESGAFYAAIDPDTGKELLALPEYAFEDFAALVAAHEREACAKVCDGFQGVAAAAKAIRARGQAKYEHAKGEKP